MICLNVAFFQFTIFEVCSASWIYTFLSFAKIGKFPSPVSSDPPWDPLFPLSSSDSGDRIMSSCYWPPGSWDCCLVEWSCYQGGEGAAEWQPAQRHPLLPAGTGWGWRLSSPLMLPLSKNQRTSWVPRGWEMRSFLGPPNNTWWAIWNRPPGFLGQEEKVEDGLPFQSCWKFQGQDTVSVYIWLK